MAGIWDLIMEALAEAHDNRLVTELLSDLKSGAMLLADEDTTRTGSEHSPVNTARGPTFLRSEIAMTRSVWPITVGAQFGRALLQQDQAMPARRHPV
jgi:hypothetical protein